LGAFRLSSGTSLVDAKIIDLTPDNIVDYGVCGYKDFKKQLELRRKIDWFTAYYPKGLRIKVVLADKGGYQGMLEYIPGKYAHRPVDAVGYMFIHCVFVGFKKEFKHKGYASALIDECIKEAKAAGMKGVAVVTRKGPFMAKNGIFLKKDFELVDASKPDFELLVLKFDCKAENPKFKKLDVSPYKEGLTIIRSPQCPYSVKNVEAIMKTAAKLGLKPRLIDLQDAESAQHTPCSFGTFCIIYNGKILSYHPISNARFENIMKTIKPT
jgi:hypothetical protein